MTGGLLGPLVVFAAAMSLTPGPNVVLVTATAANFGFRRTVPQILGITLGFATIVAATCLGLASLFQAEPRLHTGLKYLGAAYLLYLAWCIARSEAKSASGDRNRPIGPFRAALLQALNPKAWILAIGAIAAFTTAGESLLWQMLLVAAVTTGAVLGSLTIWAAFGAAIGRFLARPLARRMFNWLMASLLVISLIPVFS